MKEKIFKKQHSRLKRALSYMLVFSMVLTMGAFSQLGGIVAEAASGDIQSPVITDNGDGTYDITLTYKDETGSVSSAEVMGTLPGATWDVGSSINMSKQDGNIWSATISNVEPGDYSYKFVLDGADWKADPLNPLNANEDGTGDSLISIKGNYTHVSPEVNGKSVTFRYKSDTAKKVQLAGSMTNWADGAIALQKGSDGIWSVTKELSAGSYEYKFIVDNSWVVDQVNDSKANGNSVVVVPGLADGTLNVVKGQEKALPELYLYKDDGTSEKVKPSYSVEGSDAGVTISDGKILVSDEYAGDTIVLNAAYNGKTSKVTVSVKDAASVGEGITLKVYYHRADGVYTDWNLYMWDPDGNGSIAGGRYDFEPADDGSVVASVEVNPGAGRLGYIVRRSPAGNEWAEKDVEDDRFVDLTGVISGTVNLYIESGQKEAERENGEDVVIGIVVKSAVYNEDDHTITVNLSEKIESGDLNTMFAVSDEDGAVSISKVEAGTGNTYTVYLGEALDISKSYKITFEDRQYAVQMPVYYSSKEFEGKYTYTGNDLGATWTREKTTFRLWAPEAESVVLNRYTSGTPEAEDLIETIVMNADINGTWVAEKQGDLNGTYYTYTITRDGDTTEDVCDPYARTTGVNGKRAMVIDLASTNPDGWDSDRNPHEGAGITDAVIYEGHIRDLTVDETSGVSEANRGKFLGLTEDGAKAVSHMNELDITHLHLLPVYDFGSVDETGKGSQYNWGYDPVNYNVPEGSYSTDPTKGDVRVKEFKQMVQSLHKKDISVVMDVVYNHVYNADEFCMNKIVPKYFSRFSESGTLYSDSGCGNDTASERSMVRKYIVDSVCYWADEYHIDGYRFDLVGLLDTRTINEIVTEVHKTHPGVIFYGEGWSMANNAVADKYTMATQVNSTKTPGFAYFNDSIRDILKGSVFATDATGYVSGEQGDEETVAKNFMGAADWCSSPSQTINYVSCHDNNTLFDRIALSRSDASKEDRIRMNNLAAAIYITAEGVPFMQAGEEFLRSKVNEDGSFNENSYNAGDAVNAIRWGDLEDAAYADVFNYYKGLIAFRKAHAALRLSTAEDVRRAVSRVNGLDENVVAFDIKGGINGETADELFVIFNANPDSASVTLPAGEWSVCINDSKAGTDVIETVTNGTVTVAPISAMVLVRSGTGKNSEGSSSGNVTTVTKNPDGTSTTATVIKTVNSAGKTVEVTTSVTKTEDGSVIGTKEVTVIDNPAKDTSVVVSVQKDADGTVKEAVADVTKIGTVSAKDTKVTVSAAVTAQIKEAAGTDDVLITTVVTDSRGEERYTVTVNSKNLVTGEKLVVVAVDKKTGEYVLVNAKTYKVNEKGNVTVTLLDGKDYVLLSSKDAKKVSDDILKTVKVKKSSKTIKAGKKTTVQLSDKLNMDNVKKITYTSSNKKVATVDKNGKVKAKKKGTVTIKVKVTLNNGKTKTVTMKVKVK